MSKKMLIDATHAEETRVVVVEGNKVDEFDFESVNKRQLAGNIYLAKVTRVEPSLQAAFVDYGGNRHGFLAFNEIHPDYYQIPAADRQALIDEEAAEVERQKQEEEEAEKKSSSRSKRKISRAAKTDLGEEDVVTEELDSATEESAEDASAEDKEDSAHAEDQTAEADADPDSSDDSASDEDSDDASPNEAESVSEPEDVMEEVRPRKPRPRRYKIQEVIKVRQVLLVQVVKEERGNKGAALTTYLSLAGRYCVLMPNTARGGGISRKITNVNDRKKLKDIANTIEVPQGAGLIVRTAGAQRTKTEIKRDYEYLLRQWEQIRDLTLKSTAPTHIYEEGSLIKRSIRDLYNADIDEILIDGERGYREAKEYMKMLMPSHAKNVKQYKAVMPLFARFQVENYLAGMFNPTVQLKSGGYIVIGVTEALVAIDVNSGRATKESSIEETARKTNLEAAEEIARQLRLRDLAGLIVIDFIDMDERKNNSAVERKLKDKLKTDRARIQIGRISSFGLLEMSRQRLRPGMLEASTQPCPHCHGTGITRSNDSMSLAILRELEEEGVRRRCKEVLVSAPIEVANYMLNQKRERVAMIESRFGLSVRIEADASLISPEYRVERLKTATRIVPEVEALATIDVEYNTGEDAPTSNEDDPAPETNEDGTPKKKRRRRKRGGKGRNTQASDSNSTQDNQDNSNDSPLGEVREPEPEDSGPVDVPEAKEEAAEKPKPARKPRTTKAKTEEAPKEDPKVAEAEPEAPKAEPEPPVKEPEPSPKKPVAEKPPKPAPEQAQEEPAGPKRTGWWSR